MSNKKYNPFEEMYNFNANSSNWVQRLGYNADFYNNPLGYNSSPTPRPYDNTATSATDDDNEVISGFKPQTPRTTSLNNSFNVNKQQPSMGNIASFNLKGNNNASDFNANSSNWVQRLGHNADFYNNPLGYNSSPTPRPYGNTATSGIKMDNKINNRQLFQTPMPDTSKFFTPYYHEQPQMTLLSQGFQNNPEWNEEEVNPSQDTTPNNLIDLMTPILEGMEEPKQYLYIDTTWNKTTGIGANVDDWKQFKKVNWLVDGRPATEQEKLDAFNYFNAITSKGKAKENIDDQGNLIKNNMKAEYYEDKSPLTISKEEIKRLLKNHLKNDLEYLREEFPEFDSFPLELQKVLLDIKFNTGNVSADEWPKLRKAISEKNLFGEEGIVYNVHRKDVGEDRNNWAEREIRNIKYWR